MDKLGVNWQNLAQVRLLTQVCIRIRLLLSQKRILKSVNIKKAKKTENMPTYLQLRLSESFKPESLASFKLEHFNPIKSNSSTLTQ